jgi:tetratricopeptide (TPR) repeat protein
MAMLAEYVFLASMAFFFSPSTQNATDEVAQHARTAQEAERRNDFPTAVREYEKVVRLLPRNAEMQSNLGVALYFNGELTRAVFALQKAAALDPSLVAPHIFTGLSWYRLSNPDKAVPELQKATELSPADVIAHTWLGYAYVAQSQYATACKEFQTASELDPDNVDIWYALGQTHLEIGRGATVHLIAVAPDGGRIWQLAAEQLLLKGDRNGALKNYEKAYERRPDLTELPGLIAEMGGSVVAVQNKPGSDTAQEDKFYSQAHDAEREAQTAFERVAQIAPDSYRAHQILANAAAAAEKQDEAVKEYQVVLKQKPDLPGIHEAIGSAHLKRVKLEDALTEFEAELKIQPRSASAHANVAQVLILMNRNDEAHNHLETALGLDRPPLEIYRMLGKLALNRKDYQLAAEYLNHYISLRNDDSSAYYLLSRAYRGLGDQKGMQRALDLFQRTSLDVTARKRAESELGVLANQTVLTEETGDTKIHQRN